VWAWQGRARTKNLDPPIRFVEREVVIVVSLSGAPSKYGDKQVGENGKAKGER